MGGLQRQPARRRPDAPRSCGSWAAQDHGEQDDAEASLLVKVLGLSDSLVNQQRQNAQALGQADAHLTVDVRVGVQALPPVSHRACACARPRLCASPMRPSANRR